MKKLILLIIVGLFLIGGAHSKDTGKADIAFYNESSGMWSIWFSNEEPTYMNDSNEYEGDENYGQYQWGDNVKTPIPADYDGDGKSDIAFYNEDNGMWWIWFSSAKPDYMTTHDLNPGDENYGQYQWGGVDKTPIPADYDGDDLADIAFYNKDNGMWWIWFSNEEPTYMNDLNNYSGDENYGQYQWGVGNIPASADYDGDDLADIAFYNEDNGMWWIWFSSAKPDYMTTHDLNPGDENYGQYQWGDNVKTPIPADYDGDDLADIAFYNKDNGMWWIWFSNEEPTYMNDLNNYSGDENYGQYKWGLGNISAPADYDGDDLADIAFYGEDNGRWWIWFSNEEPTYMSDFNIYEGDENYGWYEWGVETKIPIPADYDGYFPKEVPVTLGEPIWTDLSNNPITTAELGDTVKMVITGINTTDDNVTFEINIEDETDSIWSKILSWVGLGGSSSESITSDTYTIINNSIHTFTAKVHNSNVNKTSGPLSISTTPNSNDQLSIDIITPTCGDDFTGSDEIEINISIEDLDDLALGSVTINDVFIGNISNGNSGMSYPQTTPGEYTIKAEASNSRGQHSISSVNIIVTGEIGNYAAACIDSPVPGSYFNEKIINFTATSSKAISCTADSCSKLELSDSRLVFNWTFPNNKKLNFAKLGNTTTVSGNIISKFTPYDFTADFSIPGHHPAILDLSFY
jgi:hypothetical protein